VVRQSVDTSRPAGSRPAGVAPELLADLLGHVDTRMVFRHYRHPITPTIDVAAPNMDRALEG